MPESGSFFSDTSGFRLGFAPQRVGKDALEASRWVHRICGLSNAWTVPSMRMDVKEQASFDVAHEPTNPECNRSVNFLRMDSSRCTGIEAELVSDRKGRRSPCERASNPGGTRSGSGSEDLETWMDRGRPQGP